MLKILITLLMYLDPKELSGQIFFYITLDSSIVRKGE